MVWIKFCKTVFSEEDQTNLPEMLFNCCKENSCQVILHETRHPTEAQMLAISYSKRCLGHCCNNWKGIFFFFYHLWSLAGYFDHITRLHLAAISQITKIFYQVELHLPIKSPDAINAHGRKSFWELIIPATGEEISLISMLTQVIFFPFL